METSAIDALVRRSMDPAEIVGRLRHRELIPCVGTLTFNESAQPILSDRGEVASSMFELIKDIGPRFLADPASLYERELRRLRQGDLVMAFAEPDQETYARTEVAALANGLISERFLALLRDRRKAKFEEWPEVMQGYLKLVKAIRKRDPKAAPSFRSFTQLEQHFLPDLSRFVEALGGLDLLPGEAERIAQDIALYPAIRSSIYFWWNAYYICLSDGRIPSVDKVDDYRHCIEAAYCQVFVSGDRQLLRTVNRLNSGLVPLSVTDLLHRPAV